MWVKQKTSIIKKFKTSYSSPARSEKGKKGRKLKIDLSEDEFNFSAQKERFYLQVNKEQNLRKNNKLAIDGNDKFSLFTLKRYPEDRSDVSDSQQDPRNLELSIYSNLADQYQLDTPGYWMPLNDSLLKADGQQVGPGVNNSEIISKVEVSADKQGPLTCPKSKLSQNYFSVEKQLKAPAQNLAHAIFNPQKKTNTRLAMTLNFLRSKLGEERFELVRSHYLAKNSDRAFVVDLLQAGEKELMAMIDYVFNEQSPSTQDSGSLDLEGSGLRYK